MNTQPRPRKCKACGERFTPAKPMQAVCGWQCAAKLAPVIRATKEKKEFAARKEKAKRRKDIEHEAQKAFNAWIRARDAHLPCISCGRHHQGQWHAGHYLSVGARPELRFDPDNVHKQCKPCNRDRHGNVSLYRIALIAKIGHERVEALEGPHQALKLSADELRAMKPKYMALAREKNKACA